MDLTGIATVVLAAITFVSVAVAIVALLRTSADAKAARTAELSWSVYQAYDSSELRKGRRALNTVSRQEPVPCSGKEFGDMYVMRSYAGGSKEEVSTSAIRKMLRLYHQIGILLHEGLIDANFIFPLIGDGLETSEKGIRVAVEWHQNYYGGESGNEEAPCRSIYERAKELPGKYREWKETEGGSRSTRRWRLPQVTWRQARLGRRGVPATEDRTQGGSNK